MKVPLSRDIFIFISKLILSFAAAEYRICLCSPCKDICTQNWPYFAKLRLKIENISDPVASGRQFWYNKKYHLPVGNMP